MAPVHFVYYNLRGTAFHSDTLWLAIEVVQDPVSECIARSFSLRRQGWIAWKTLEKSKNMTFTVLPRFTRCERALFVMKMMVIFVLPL